MSKKYKPMKTPGPADYSVRPLVGFTAHSLNSQKPRAPQWSIGQRHNPGSALKKPGPSDYDIKNTTRHGKYFPVALSIPNKHKGLKSDKVPGPSYNATDAGFYRWKYEPKQTISTHLTPQRIDANPGPAHEPTPIHIYKHHHPRFSIREKTRGLKPDPSPGPSAYNIHESKSKTIHASPSFTHRWHVNDGKRVKTPGPSDYDLTRHNPFSKDPAYTIQQKVSDFTVVKLLPKDNC